MFRIKNIRNSTVAKQNQLSPVPIKAEPIASNVLQSKADPKKNETRPHNNVLNNQQPRLPSKLQQKVRTPKLDHKLKLVSKAHVDQIAQEKKGKLSFQLKHPFICRHEKPKLLMEPGSANKPEKQASGIQIDKQRLSGKQTQKIEFPAIQESKEETIQEPQMPLSQQEQPHRFIRKEEEPRRSLNQEQQSTQQQAQQEREREKQQQRELARQKQHQQEARREKELKEMMEKVESRRRAREQQKRQQKKAEEERAQLLREQQSPAQIAGVFTLNDPLAHVQMNEALMDRQVQMLLNMKFAGYPNQEVIQHQVQELERINRSYLLVRENPSNPLITGLANFRIELFNRVGELVMEGQRQMGPSASGLRILQADNLNGSPLEGVKITRGLEGHIQRLLKRKLLGQRDECPICLHRMEKGDEVYQVNCGHHFHKNCLEEWLRNTANCPVCRYNIKFDHP